MLAYTKNKFYCLLNVVCPEKDFMVVTASFHCVYVICEFKLDLQCLQYCHSSVVVTTQEGDGDSSLTDGPVLQTASAPAQSIPLAMNYSLATEAPKPLTSTVEPLIEGYSHIELSDITKGI